MIKQASVLFACLTACGSPAPHATPTAPSPSTATPAAPPASSKPIPPPTAMPWARSGVDWTKPPTAAKRAHYAPPRANEYTLANGIRVITVARARLPLVSIRIVNTAGGSINDPRGRAGLAALTSDMLDEGAGPWNATELATHLEQLGADLWVGVDADTGAIALDTLTSTLDASLAVVAAVLTRPRFAAADFTRVKTQRIGRIRRRADQAAQAAQIVFDRVVFGGHPYSNPISGDVATVRRIKLAQAKRFYRRHWSPRHLTIIATGDFSHATLRSILARRFGTWRPRHRAPPRLRATTRNVRRPRLYLVNRPASPQTTIIYGRRMPMLRSDPRHYAASVANTMLGGSYTSQLNNRLREQLGYTYGASSSFWYGVGGATWSVSTSIAVANTVAGIKETMALVDGLRTRPIPLAEFSRAKQLLARKLPQQFETNADVASSIATLVRHRQPTRWHASYASRIEAVAPSQARSFAQASWRGSDLTLIVVGDLAKFLPELLRLGFGTALAVDVDGNVLRTYHSR